MSGVHVFSRVREAHPDTFQVALAGQLNPDGIVAGYRQYGIRFQFRERAVGIDALHIMILQKAAGSALTISRTHNLRVKITPCRMRGDVNTLHNEPSQAYIVIRTIEEPVMIQPIQEPEDLLNGLRVLQLHSALKQQSLFRSHTSEPLLQPVVLRLAHLHTVQGIEEAVPHSPTSMLEPPWLWE